MALKLVSTSRCFEGEQRVYSHESNALKCEMKFGVFVPPSALTDNVKCPALYYLSGLTCTHENFIQKSGAQQYAAKYGLIVINPDTSPRNVDIPGADDEYDFGSGASFYVNATAEPWSKYYQMFTYVTEELPALIEANFPVQPSKKGICGHSMGGHGAMICALKCPGMFQSASVFAPVSSASSCKLGTKAYNGYLGADKSKWTPWDATHLTEKYDGPPLEILVDQGDEDEFLKNNELQTDNFVNVAKCNERVKVIYKERKGYDHGYFYVSTFMGEHMAYHAKLLLN